jgi:8-oxo-dGTP pyrophosphatase MutT (NUDIX family)
MKQKDRIIVSAILLSKDNKVFLGKIRKGGAYPDCWHIPGGGVEGKENKTDALFREIQEEVGLDIRDEKLELVSDSDTGEAIKTDKATHEEFLVKMFFNVFLVKLNKNAEDIKISLNDDLIDFTWAPLTKLKDYKHTPPSEKLFRKIGWL